MRLLLCLVSPLVLVILASCAKPPLEIRRTDSGVVLDLQTLGEYPTSVDRLRLVQIPEDILLWEVTVAAGTPQIWTINLVAGSNPSHPRKGPVAGDWKVVYPETGNSFELERAVRYRVTVWGEGPRPATAEFSL